MRRRPPGGGGRCCIANIAMLAIVANIAMVANWAIVNIVDTGNWPHVGRRPTIFFQKFFVKLLHGIAKLYYLCGVLVR